MGVFILLWDPIGLLCGPLDRLPECASLVPIKFSQRGESSRPRPAGPSSGGTISVLIRGAPHHASSPCGTRIGPRQSSRRSPGSHQKSSTSHLQLAARSLSLTWSYSLALGSPHHCPTLLVLRNSGPAQPEPSGRLPSADLSGRVVAPPGSNQGSSAPLPQQAARSLSLTWRHSLASSSPHLCPTLLVLRNSGPALPGPSWPASLHRSRQPGRRSPRGNQGSSTPQPQQAARSLSLTWSHSPASSSPHRCPMLLVLRNSGLAQPGPSWSASLNRSRQPGRRSLGGNQGGPPPQPHQVARSLSLSRTRSHSMSSGSPPLCPALLALRNPGPA
ncbi:hypothetical protein NDU88_007323 [Pleurodeles waltl]|uniref:Uncharacterized protein n=1 Tax=Pleurodeles waltl TaxID=8319 RepID=A0AAV7UNH3_PLEWA|nr:hypothetical protein NDU88_007323 [Pleurodeles waltl]